MSHTLARSDRAADWFASIRGVRVRFPATLFATIASAALLQFVVNNAPASWLYDPTGAEARCRCVERLILSCSDDPSVVFLGSSRTAFGINPREFDDAFGSPPGRSVNAGLIGGDLSLVVELYRRNREKFRGSKFVVANVDDWHLNSGRGAGGFGHALMVLFTELRVHAALMRDAALVALGLAEPKSLNVAVDDDGQMWFTPYDDRHLVWTPEICGSIVADYYMKFATGPEAVAPLIELAEMVRADGACLVLIQMPNAPNYHAELLRLQGGNYRRQLDELRRFAAEHDVAFLNFDSAAACGLEPEDYSDGVHLRRQGARKFARHLASQLKKHEPTK